MKTFTYFTCHHYTYGDELELSFNKHKHFATEDLARIAVKKFYKPLRNLNITSLRDPVLHRKVVTKEPIYKKIKRGKDKDNYALDKNGNKIIDYYIDVDSFEKIADYTKFNVNKTTFYSNYLSEYRINDYDGYFELDYIETSVTDTKTSVDFNCIVKVRFVSAFLSSVPEVKVPGEPYVAGSRKIVETSKSDWYDVFVCNGSSIKTMYGIHSNLDNWFRSVPLTLTDSITILTSSVELCDCLEDMERVESNTSSVTC